MMTLQEWVDEKKSDLMAKGYRKVELTKDVRPAMMGSRGVSFDVFSREVISMDTKVKDVDRDNLPPGFNEEGMIPAAMVTLDVLPPRKRKVRTETFYVAIA